MTTTTNKLVKTKHKAAAVETSVRLASVPDESVADKYIGRIIHGRTDEQIFEMALKEGMNVLLEGDTGAGKTLAAMAFAARKRMPFYSVPNNVGIDPSQLFGKFVPDEDGIAVGVWQDGPVTDLVRHGGVLLINEVNFLPPRVATVLFSLLDGRREIALLDHKGEVIKAHPNLLIIGDMNPDYLGTQPLNDAFRNRFEIQLQWDYDDKVEAALVKSKTLLSFAKNIRKRRRDGDIETPLSTNMMVEFENIAGQLGLAFAMENMVQHFTADDRKAIKEVLKQLETGLERDYAPKPEVKPKRVQDGWEHIDEDIENWANSL